MESPRSYHRLSKLFQHLSLSPAFSLSSKFQVVPLMGQTQDLNGDDINDIDDIDIELREDNTKDNDQTEELNVDDIDDIDDIGVGSRERSLTDISKSKSTLLHILASYTDAEIVELVLSGKISHEKLERELKRSLDKGMQPDCTRAVRIRRLMLSRMLGQEKMPPEPKNVLPGEKFKSLLYKWGLPCYLFDYEKFYLNVLGKNCENVIGYVPVPVGFVGPLLVNGKDYYIPMATTEGTLLDSTNRGCRAITESGGAAAHVYNNGMTRAPVVRLSSARESAKLKMWLDIPENIKLLQKKFATTTKFGKLLSIQTLLAGRMAYLRFKCSTGDAMGMNMVTKGVVACLGTLEEFFPKMVMLSISGNACTDKKPSAINWIEGRGKSVAAECVLSAHVLATILNCTAPSLVAINRVKNLVGSAIVGSVGGNNAHATNIISALFLATGQDIAQVVASSTCMTLMELTDTGGLHVSVTLPSLEVGTVGGGTALLAQKACLKMLGLDGPTERLNGLPGMHANQLAKVFAGAVLAGEISVLSELASDQLASRDLKFNHHALLH